MHHVERDRDGYVLSDYLDDELCPVWDFTSFRRAKQADCKHLIVPMEGGGKTCKRCHMVAAWS